jgi:hypothetical protein
MAQPWLSDPIVGQAPAATQAPAPAAPRSIPGTGPKPTPTPAPPSGYRWAPDGSLEVISGGPADKPTGGAGSENKNIPEVSARGIQGNLTTLAEIEGALATLNGRPESIGPGTGFFGDYVTQFNDPDGTQARAMIGQIGAAKIHDLSGAAVSASEAPRFNPFVPSVTDRPEVARQKLERFRDELLNQINEADAYYSPANGYMPYTTPGMEAYRQRSQASTQAGAPPAFGGGAAPVVAPPAAGSPPISEGAPPTLGPAGPGINADGMIAGNVHDAGAAQVQGLLTDAFRQEDDPALAGVRGEYLARLGRGDSAQEIIQWARTAGISPTTFGSIAKQVQFRRLNPQVALSEYDTGEIDDRFVEVDPRVRSMTDLGRSPVGAGIIAAGDAASGFTLDNLVGMTGGNAEQARLGMGQIAAENPKANLAGTVVGGTLAALAAEGTAGVAGIGAGAARTIGADTLFGLAAGAGGTDYASDGTPATATDRLVGAGKGGLAALVTGGIANRILPTPGGTATGSVQSLDAAGVPMTLGQRVGPNGRLGAMVKGAEDRVAGLPVVGDMINARRREGVSAFNTSAFNKALEPVGGSISGKVGADAVADAHQQVQDAFTTALAGRAVNADAQFATDLTNASTRTLALPRVGPEVGDSVREILAPYMTGAQITGETMQTISRELRALKAGYAKSEPALASRIGKSIDATEDAIFGMFRRQAPDVLPAYDAAKQAFRRVSILADAVNAADNQADGLFTPAQLNRADKTNAKKYEGSLSAAAGPRQFRDYARAAQDVLPNMVPDSGTAGRIILPLVAGGMVGADQAFTDNGVNGGTLTLAAILAGAYTKAGQRVLTKPSRGVKTGVGRAITSEPSRKAIGAAASSSAAALTTQ